MKAPDPNAERWRKRNERRGDSHIVDVKISFDPAAPAKKKASKKAMSSLDDLSFMGVDLRPVAKAPEAPKPPPVTWDDVCGQAKAKAAVREAIETTIKHADVYQRFGRKPPRGILLYGPPGNGKTMLAKAAATAAAELYSKSKAPKGVPSVQLNGRPDIYRELYEAISGGTSRKDPRSFIPVKGPELASMYYGGTEKNIRELFAEARQHKERYGFPAIIFLDEAESLLASRGSRWIPSTVVPAFLAEMDGFADSSAIVILATNRQDDLDPAVIRDGRIDAKIYVGRPERADVTEIITRNLANRPLVDSLEVIVKRACDELFDPKHALYRIHFSEGLPKTVTLRHVLSCAQVVGVVERATSRAIDRAIRGDGPEGLTAADFEAEVLSTLEESRGLFHVAELTDFMASLASSRAPATQIERIRSGEESIMVKPAAIGQA